MPLGSRLRERRQQLGLTLEEVAQAVGVSKSTVQKWESGTIEDMRLAKAAGLAKVLKVSPLWIMGIRVSGVRVPDGPPTKNTQSPVNTGLSLFLDSPRLTRKFARNMLNSCS